LGYRFSGYRFHRHYSSGYHLFIPASLARVSQATGPHNRISKHRSFGYLISTSASITNASAGTGPLSCIFGHCSSRYGYSVFA
jgi:hypothetical protein